MKLLTGAALTLCLVIGTVAPVRGQSDESMLLVGGQQVTGRVESIDGSTVRLRTTGGEVRILPVQPSAISALNLKEGSELLVDGSQLKTGRVSGLDVQTIKVDLDNGETETFFTQRSSSGGLLMGDRVVISADDTITPAEDFQLMACHLRLMQTVAARSIPLSRPQVAPPPAIEPAPIIEAPPPPENIPVPGLW